MKMMLPHIDIATSNRDNPIMRTTVDIDEEVLRVVKDLARERSASYGKVLSDLARRGLQPAAPTHTDLGEIPTLARKPGARPVTSQMVKDLLELEA